MHITSIKQSGFGSGLNTLSKSKICIKTANANNNINNISLTPASSENYKAKYCTNISFAGVSSISDNTNPNIIKLSDDALCKIISVSS